MFLNTTSGKNIEILLRLILHNSFGVFFEYRDNEFDLDKARWTVQMARFWVEVD